MLGPICPFSVSLIFIKDNFLFFLILKHSHLKKKNDACVNKYNYILKKQIQKNIRGKITFLVKEAKLIKKN